MFNRIKSGGSSILLKLIIVAAVLLLLWQSGFDFGLKTQEEPSAEKDTISGTVIISAEKKLAEDPVLRDPEQYSAEFELVIKAISKAWENLELDKETYESLKKNEQAFQTVNKLLDYRVDHRQIPGTLNQALQKYVKSNENKEEILRSYLEGNNSITIVREYQNSQWILILKSKTEEKTGSTTVNDSLIKPIGLD